MLHSMCVRADNAVA